MTSSSIDQGDDVSISTFFAGPSRALMRVTVTLALTVAAAGSLLPISWAGPAASGGNLTPDQVHDTPLMSITRELNEDGGPCNSTLTCGGGTDSGPLTIGQTSGPSLANPVTNVPTAPDTSAQPPSGTTQVISGGSKIPASGKVTVCADGWVDSMGRPFFGDVLNGLITWTGGPFIPSESSFDASPIQTATLPADPGTYAGTFPWIGGSYALNTSVNSTATSSTTGTMQAGVEINPGQTIAYLSAGPNGNCAQLLQACQADSGSAMVDPNTVSTDLTQIGGVNCVNYFANCQVSTLLNASRATPFVTSSSDPEGVTGGYCQVFSTAPACSDLLTLYQTSAPNFNCTCTSPSQAPFCQVQCPKIVQAWQVDVGPLAVCSCASASGAPSCQPDCLGQLGSAQAAAGDTHTCSCSPNSSMSSPACPLNCKGLLPQFQAQNPNYTCTCPTGTAVVANPVCQPTCKALAINKQASLGSNYTCSCQDPTSTTEQPSCPMNCGGLMATQAQYQTSANQICSCPSGNNVVATPQCVPTCGAQLSATSCPAGSVATCPNGNTVAGTPTCQQQTCGTLLPNWTCGANQVASCPSGSSAASNPVCQTTCGSQLAATVCPAGQAASCPGGNTVAGTPTCQQQTCGALVQGWSCPSGQAATCPSGGAALSNPQCAQTCGSQLATASCPLGQTPTCPGGASVIGAPSCQQQSCGTLLPSWACTAPATASCPNGTSALSNPQCAAATCGSYPASYCPAGSLAACPSGTTATSPPTCTAPNQCTSVASCGAGQVGACPRTGGAESCVTVVTAGYSGNYTYFSQPGLIGTNGTGVCTSQQRGQKVTVNSVCGTYQAMCGLANFAGNPNYLWWPYLPSISSHSFPNPITSCLLGFTSQNYYIGNGDIFTDGQATNGANCSYFEGGASGATVTSLTANDPGCP